MHAPQSILMVLPTYRSEVERDGEGSPSRVVLELVRGGAAQRQYQNNERTLFEYRAISSALTQGARRALRSTPGWGRRAIDNTVFGWIQAVNVNNAASRFSGRRISVGQISGEQIQTLMEQLQQSNEELTLYTSEWAFIFDMNTVRLGGAALVAPKWVKDRPMHYWKRYTYDGHVINCAAYSIAYRTTLHAYKFQNRVLKKAYALMKQMSWGEMVTPDELGRYVDMYPEYRLCILGYVLKSFGATTYDGAYFTIENKKKIIYLIFDLEKHHYAAVEGPLVFVTNKALKWCDTCISYFHPEKGNFILFRMFV